MRFALREFCFESASKKVKEFFDRDVSLEKNASQNAPGEIKPVVTRNGDAKMGPRGMSEMNMAARLVMYLETSPQNCAQNLARFEDREC